MILTERQRKLEFSCEAYRPGRSAIERVLLALRAGIARVLRGYFSGLSHMFLTSKTLWQND